MHNPSFYNAIQSCLKYLQEIYCLSKSSVIAQNFKHVSATLRSTFLKVF